MARSNKILLATDAALTTYRTLGDKLTEIGICHDIGDVGVRNAITGEIRRVGVVGIRFYRNGAEIGHAVIGPTGMGCFSSAVYDISVTRQINDVIYATSH